MKCSLLLAGAYAGQSDWEAVDVECNKEDCGWWDPAGQRCAMISIPEELRLLVGAAGMIIEEAKKAGE